MTKNLRPTRLIGAMLVGLPLFVSSAASAGEGPYVVSGNQHIIIGITLDEATVRSALPAGLEPAEGVTGGLNVYRSDGGAGVAAYERTYVWVDLKDHDSLTGAKGRYILWAADSAHSKKLGRIGYDAEVGQTTLNADGKNVTGSTASGGAEVVNVEIQRSDDPCNDAVGTMNYPSMPAGSEGLAVTQYAFAGTICGATPVSVEITAPADHPLQKFHPASVVWAAFVPDLSFSGSPLLPLKTAASD